MRDAGDVSYPRRVAFVFADPPSALLKLDAKQRLELAFFAEPAATLAEPKTTGPGSLKVVQGKLSEIRKKEINLS
jgi:hypothetical protein